MSTEMDTTVVVSDVVTSDVVVAAKKPRKQSALKDKVVVFTLSRPVMRMPDMRVVGYQRKEIEALFVALAAAGHGEHVAGTQGKGHEAKFIASETMPDTLTLTFQVRKLHNDYVGKPGTPVMETAAEPVVMADVAVSVSACAV